VDLPPKQFDQASEAQPAAAHLESLVRSELENAVQPTPQGIRRRILEYVFECHLPPLKDRIYFLEWGGPQTAQRLNKHPSCVSVVTEKPG
jgi:hypothetical protein